MNVVQKEGGGGSSPMFIGTVLLMRFKRTIGKKYWGKDYGGWVIWGFFTFMRLQKRGYLHLKPKIRNLLGMRKLPKQIYYA